MASFLSVENLIRIVLLMDMILAQDTICVWNADDEWRQLNGEYVLHDDDRYNDQYYWTQNNTACTDEAHSISATQYGFLYYWTLSAIDTNTSTDAHVYQMDDIPVCSDNGAPYILPHDPTLCMVGYHVNKQPLSLTLTSGACPSLSCNVIYLSLDPESIECSGIYTKYNSQNNIYKREDDTYLYFNANTFKWHCSQSVAVHQCNDTQTIISSLYHEWYDFDESTTFAIEMIHSNADIFNAKFICVDAINTTTEPTNEQLPINSYTPPKMPRLMHLVDWYFIAALLLTIFCALSVLRWCVRAWRINKKTKKATKPRYTSRSIIITPPQNINVSKPVSIPKTTMTQLTVDTNINSLNTVVHYGTYTEDYLGQETLKLTNGPTATIEMQNNQLYILRDDDEAEDEDDDTVRIGSPTMMSITENRALQTPSATTTIFRQHNSASVRPQTHEIEDTCVTMSSLDDIYGKYDPSDIRQPSLPSNIKFVNQNSMLSNRTFYQ